LGAGRLVRTYVDAAVLAINKAKIYTVHEAYAYRLTLSHSHYDLLLRHLRNNDVDIDETYFEEEIIMDVSCLNEIEDLLILLFHNQIKIEKLDKKIKYK
jgi:putative IMPACT (imprinted ancient) family translation regulator